MSTRCANAQQCQFAKRCFRMGKSFIKIELAFRQNKHYLKNHFIQYINQLINDICISVSSSLKRRFTISLFVLEFLSLYQISSLQGLLRAWLFTRSWRMHQDSLTLRYTKPKPGCVLVFLKFFIIKYSSSHGLSAWVLNFKKTILNIILWQIFIAQTAAQNFRA